MPKGQTGEGGRADGKALAGGGRGIAQRVEGVGTAAHFSAQAAHLGITAGIVGYGAVGIGGQGDTKGREHTHGGDTYAVEAHGYIAEIKARSKPVAEDDTGYYGYYGYGG